MSSAVYSTDYSTDERLEQRWKHLIKMGKRTAGVVSGQNPLECPPTWFDEKRFSEGQKLCKLYNPNINFSQLIGSFFMLLIPDLLVPLLATQSIDTVYKSGFRGLITGAQINSWYEGNPFNKNSTIYSSLRRVRCICHLQVTQLLNRKYPDKKLVHPQLDDQSLWMSQFQMATALWGFIGLLNMIPNLFGFNVNKCLYKLREEVFNLQRTRSETDRFELFVKKSSYGFRVCLKQRSSDKLESEYVTLKTCITPKQAKQLYILQEITYVWRVLGYCIGVKDEFNVAGEECIVRNATFLCMCFDREFRPKMEHPNQLVQLGHQVIEGTFEAAISVFQFLTYDGLMKYLYEQLNIPHQFELKTFKQKFSYVYMSFFKFILGNSIVQRFVTMLSTLFAKRLIFLLRSKESDINRACRHIRFQILDKNGKLVLIENKIYKPII